MYKTLQIVNGIKWTKNTYDRVCTILWRGDMEAFNVEGLKLLNPVKELLWWEQCDDEILGNGPHLGMDTLTGQKYVLVAMYDQKQEVMERMYRNVATTANGRDSFWSQIANKYAGISRADVVGFLSNQESYQRHRPVMIRKDVVPIATSRPSDLWQVDTIDMNKLAAQNQNYSRCLTVIDHFSKYAWVMALKDNTALSTATAMIEILKSLPKDLWPIKVQSDNGTEFKGQFEALLKSHKIVHSHSYAYTPHAQGCIEVFNKTFKRKVYSLLTLNDDKKWVEYIKEIVDNYNTTRHSRTRWSPKDVFLGTKNLEFDTQIRTTLASKMALHRKKAGLENQKGVPNFAKDDPRQINEKDYVRISRHTWNPDRMAVEGEGAKNSTFTKKYLANWSREVYIVHKITKPRHVKDFENKFWFSLRTVGGLVLQRQFYRQDLLKVDIANTKNGKGEEMSAQRAAQDATKVGVDDEIELVYNRRNAKIAASQKAKMDKTPHPWLIGKVLDICKGGEWYTRGLVIAYTAEKVKRKNTIRQEMAYSVRTDVPATKDGVAPSGKVSKNNKDSAYSRVPASWINKPGGSMGCAWRIKASYDSDVILRSSTD